MLAEIFTARERWEQAHSLKATRIDVSEDIELELFHGWRDLFHESPTFLADNTLGFTEWHMDPTIAPGLFVFSTAPVTPPDAPGHDKLT